MMTMQNFRAWALLIAFCYISSGALAQQNEVSPLPSTGKSGTIPGTGGYGVGGGLPNIPGNVPPDSGGYVGGRYPPDKGPTKTGTTCNGKPC